MPHPLFGEAELRLAQKPMITDVGVFTQEQLLVGKMLHDYDSQLNLVRIENPNILDGELPFAVYVMPNIGMPYPLFYLRESEITPLLYARVIAGDMARQGRPLADQLEANEMARQLFEAAKREEELAEASEIAKSILKSKLNKYVHNGKVYRS